MPETPDFTPGTPDFTPGAVADDAADASDAILPTSGMLPTYPTLPPVLVTESHELASLLPSLLAAPELGFDTETTGLKPYSDRVRLIQLATPEQTYVIDCFKVDPRLL